MKKFTKILAVLMTVCLLFGVVAAFGTSAAVASSSKESDLFVNASGNSTGTMATPTHRYWATFDNDVLKATPNEYTVTVDTQTNNFIDSYTKGGNATQRFGVSAGTANKSYPGGFFIEKFSDGEGYIAFRKVENSFRITDADGNLILTSSNFSNNKAPSLAAPEHYFDLTHNATINNIKNYSQHLNVVDYATVDFDYGTDRWAYQINGVWQTGVTVPDGAVNVRPALAGGTIAISLTEFDIGASAWTKQRDNAKIQIIVYQDEATGYFFLSGSSASYTTTTTNKNYDGEYTEGVDMWLSNQPGVLDHFTTVLDVTTNADKEITTVNAHIFVNGVYFRTWSFTSPTTNLALYGVYAYPIQLGTKLEDNSLMKENDMYSFVFDNIVPNYYKNYVDASNTGYQYYETANGLYGLDDYLASADVYNNVNLAKCPDTLYGIYEQRDDAIAIIDGVKHKVVGNTVDLGDMISNNSTVMLPAGKAFTASPAADVESFNVTLGDGATLTTKSGAYKAVESDGTYALTKIATKANVSLFTDMAFNLYVPADAGFTADGFVDTTIGGVAYKQYTWNPELGSFDSASVTLNYGEVSSVIELDVVKYATLVADAFDCNTAQAKLAYEIMDYKAAVAKYLDPDFDAANVAALNAFYALYEEHADGCTCGAEAEIDANAINKGILEGKTISFLLESGKFSIVLGGFTAGESVSVVIGEGKDAYTATLTADAEGDVVFNDVNAALLRFTFDVTTSAGAGQYRLSAYIAALSDGADKNLAVAMYEYSAAVYSYKTLPVEN